MNGVIGTISITSGRVCPKNISELGEFVSGTLLILIYAIAIIRG